MFMPQEGGEVVDKFEWEDPHETTRKRDGKYRYADETAMKLADSKGKWACIAIYASYWSATHRASRIRTGKLITWVNVGSFETTVRQTPEGFKVFARCTSVKSAFDEGRLEVRKESQRTHPKKSSRR